MDAASYVITLAQTGEELIESGRMWQQIGAIGVALGGLLMGLTLIFNKDKPGTTTDPRVAMVANVIGVLAIIGGIGIAIYIFAIT